MPMKTRKRKRTEWSRAALVFGWSIFLILLVSLSWYGNTSSTRKDNAPEHANQTEPTSAASPSTPPAQLSQFKPHRSSSVEDPPAEELEPTASINFIPVFESVDLGADIATVNYQVEQPLGRVLIVRGIFTVFSLGMNDLGKRLQTAGYDVRVTTAIQSSAEVEKMSWMYGKQFDQVPLIIIGHSLGGDLAPRLASNFGKHNIPVDLLLMLDSTMPSAPPRNVRRCVNLFQSSNKTIFQGREIRSWSPQTELFNIDIRQLASPEHTADIHHFNIDTNPWVHDLIVDAVYQGTHFDTLNMPAENFDFQYSGQQVMPPAAPQTNGVRMTFGDAPSNLNHHQKR